MLSSAEIGNRPIRPSEVSRVRARDSLGPMAKTPEERITSSAHKEFVGQNLADARKALRKTQAKMAEEMGLAQNKLSQWESGLFYPDPWKLKQLCEDHGFTMDWFYRRIRSGVSVERADDLRRVEAEGAAAAMAEAEPQS
jgi:transcriptional regulator with XRE-family HTH domain